MTSKRIIYVLCYDDESERKATEDFQAYDWARVYRIRNQNYFLEGVFYMNELLPLYNEWKDADFVGTLSYKFFDRFQFYGKSAETIIYQIQNVSKEQFDAVSFVTSKGSLIGELPYLERILYDTIDLCKMNVKQYNAMKRKFENTIVNLKSNFVIHNYWMCKPHYMLQYIEYFKNQWIPNLEKHPLVWANCPYTGSIPKETHLKLTNGRANHYVYHPYVNELFTTVFLKHLNLRTLYL